MKDQDILFSKSAISFSTFPSYTHPFVYIAMTAEAISASISILTSKDIYPPASGFREAAQV
jgi:hypothetical protein